MKENWIFALFGCSGLILMGHVASMRGEMLQFGHAVAWYLAFVIGLIIFGLSLGKLIYEMKNK